MTPEVSHPAPATVRRSVGTGWLAETACAVVTISSGPRTGERIVIPLGRLTEGSVLVYFGVEFTLDRDPATEEQRDQCEDGQHRQRRA